MNTYPDIALLGRKRAGKDTVADLLVRDYGYTKLGFADPLRALARELNPLIDAPRGYWPEVRYADLEARIGYEQAKGFPEYRGTLQRLGVAVRMVLGEDTWVDHLISRWEKVDGPVVVTDVRFPNEYNELTAMDFLTVRVERPGPRPEAEHISESALDDHDVDYTLPNGSTIDALHDYVRALLGPGVAA